MDGTDLLPSRIPNAVHHRSPPGGLIYVAYPPRWFSSSHLVKKNNISRLDNTRSAEDGYDCLGLDDLIHMLSIIGNLLCPGVVAYVACVADPRAHLFMRVP